MFISVNNVQQSTICGHNRKKIVFILRINSKCYFENTVELWRLKIKVLTVSHVSTGTAQSYALGQLSHIPMRESLMKCYVHYLLALQLL